MTLDPYDASARGIAYRDYRVLQELEEENGWVDPYAAEARGVPYSSWRIYVDESQEASR